MEQQKEAKKRQQPKSRAKADKSKKKEADIVEKRERNIRNHETNIISFVFTGLFLLMIGYLIYFDVAKAGKIVDNSYNKRIDNLQTKVVRGDILAADGTVLATTQTDDEGNETRVYPYGSMFSHVVGIKKVKTGIEGAANFELLSHSDDFISQLLNDISGNKEQGNNVITTLNVKLQKAAYDALGNTKGAIVVMEPDTGKILAMVSKPDFDPNEADEKYSQWRTYESSESVLLNRATQGLYAPGSTFKIITAIEYIREHKDYNDYTYQCSGSAGVTGGTTIPCSDKKAHGFETLETAFANSCNSAFSLMGLELNIGDYRKLCNSFLFNTNLSLGIESSKSSFVLDENSSISEIQETAFGQGKTMISPIHNLMIAATVANGGVMMQPYVIDEIRTADGDVLEKFEPKQRTQVLTEDEAYVMTNYMRAVVTKGTATALRSAGYEAAAKTGTAQFGNEGLTHTWFVGFAPYDSPQIAVCVIIEGDNKNAVHAQNYAKKVFDAYFE